MTTAQIRCCKYSQVQLPCLIKAEPSKEECRACLMAQVEQRESQEQVNAK